MNGAAVIAWIGAWIPDPAREPAGRGRWGTGAWGQPDELQVPLDDRGLLLADGLFETLLVEQGEIQLLAEHHRRWRQGAALLALPPPPDLQAVRQLAAEAIQRSGIHTGALRLNWSRGSGGRGLDPAAAGARGTGGRFWLQLSACTAVFSPLAVILSPSERRCATSLLSRTKSFAYGSAIQARLQARAAGADDALLESTAGGLCCGTAANLLLRLQGRWLTPPLSSGCLPGVMRQRALERSGVEEAPLPLTLLRGAPGSVAALLINSLGCRPIHRCDDLELQPLTATQAEAFWRRLL